MRSPNSEMRDKTQTPPLLGGAFLPITSRIYFLEAPASEAIEGYISWTNELPPPLGQKHDITQLEGTLASMLDRLPPLTNDASRLLFAQTASAWTAVFVNQFRVGDFFSAASQLSRIHRWRATIVSYTPDWTELCGKPKNGPLGDRGFSLYFPDPDSSSLIKRVVQTGNQGSGWEFSESGPIQSFETPEIYQKKQKMNRLTPDLIQKYCQALGIRVFDSGFYGPRGYVVARTDRPIRGVALSVAQEEFSMSAQYRPWEAQSTDGS